MINFVKNNIFSELRGSPNNKFVWRPNPPCVMIVGKIISNIHLALDHVVLRDDGKMIALGIADPNTLLHLDDRVIIVAATIIRHAALIARTYHIYGFKNSQYASGGIYYEASEAVMMKYFI